MAIYHLSAQMISRSAGRSAVAAAAYRSASRFHDERLGQTFDFSRKSGVEHSEIIAPEKAPAWVHDREKLWNAVEAAEKRKDAQLCREVRVALPNELGLEDQKELVRQYCQEQFALRGMVADVSIHRDDPNNPHAHILLSTRTISEHGFEKKERAWNDTGLLIEWRAEWAQAANRSLERAGLDQRIDHRSFRDQGIALEPTIKIGSERESDHRFVIQERLEKHEAIVRRNGDAIRANPELALDALTRQRATFTQSDVARFLGPRTIDAEQFQVCLARVMGSDELIQIGKDARGQERFSTREMREVEQKMMSFAEALNQKKSHAVHPQFALQARSTRTLSPEQKDALTYLTIQSRDLAVIEGYAGTGKSYLLGAAKDAWEGEGYRVLGAALSGKAAEGLEVGSGIASRSLASWEYAWGRGKDGLSKNDVFVIDEAAMVGTRQMGRVLEHAEKAGAKVVLVGDTEQLQAIEAGAPMRAIGGQVGHVTLSEIRRQKDPEQALLTQAMANGSTDLALKKYREAGKVHAHPTQNDAMRSLIGEWNAERKSSPEKSQIMIAYRREEVRTLNLAARELLKKDGELSNERTFETERGARAFAEGDRVCFLKNDRDLDVKNGTLGTVEQIKGSVLGVRTDDGRFVAFSPEDYRHIDHGYAVTAYKAQGMTVDRAHVLASELFDRHATYVALSRHRENVSLHFGRDVFKDDQALDKALSRARPKDMVLDYAEVHETNLRFREERLRPRDQSLDVEIERSAAKGSEKTSDRPKTVEEHLEAMSPEKVRDTYRRLEETIRQGPTTFEKTLENLKPLREAKETSKRADQRYEQAKEERLDFEVKHPFQSTLAERGFGKNAEIFQREKVAQTASEKAYEHYMRVREDPELRRQASERTREHNLTYSKAFEWRERAEPFMRRAEREFEHRREERAKEIAKDISLSRSRDRGFER